MRRRWRDRGQRPGPVFDGHGWSPSATPVGAPAPAAPPKPSDAGISARPSDARWPHPAQVDKSAAGAGGVEVRESCGCGANAVFTALSIAGVNSLAAPWRDRHSGCLTTPE